MSQEKIRLGFRRHAALAQFHRWYQVYENTASTVDKVIDALAIDVTIKPGLDEAKGHDAYRQREAQLPKTWKKTHFPRNIRITPHADGATELITDLTYLNIGMKPDVVRSSELTYALALKNSDTVLPNISNVLIAQNSEGTAPAYKDG